ncbi:MAG: ATP-binding cassette domain-containing protein [bacterium]|nr:ATP-binding cassette domain-containing protein [bacterium]
MLSVKNLSYRYEASNPISFSDFSVEEGGKLLILGDSGKGKTTLLHLISGLLKSQNGEIQLDDTLINDLKETDRDHFRGKHIGLVFQKPHLLSALNVLDNLLLCQFLGGLKKDMNKIKSLLEEVGLGDKAHASISQLSQGQAQRVSVVRALLNDPRLILADEPTSSLDDDNAKSVLEILQKKAQENNSVLVIATHDHRVKESISNYHTL